MWCPLFLVLLAGAATADHLQAWKTDTEYQYAIRGRTLAALHDISDQYSGIIQRALLTVLPKSDGTLEAKVTKAQFAQVDTKLPDGWDSAISDSMLEFKQFPLSEKVFKIKMQHGVVRDLIVDKDVSTWEVNVLKSIVSQLQVDTQGENMIASRSNQEPEDSNVNAMFKTMEDSIGGKCEVLYDINPLPEFVVQSKPELVSLPEARGDDEVIDIIKTKNFNNCEQRPGYHFGISGSNKWEPGTSDKGNFLSRSSISRIIITGDLKTFTIQSSVSTNKVILSPSFNENSKGMVSSRVNVTLIKMGASTSGEWSTPVDPESTGNLVYSYNNPFANAEEDRRAGKPQENLNSDEEHKKLFTRYWQKKTRQQDDDDESNSSDPSKDVNSMESSKEQLNLQQKPTLNEAPSLPLLPFFIGNRGKSIHKADQFDVVATVKSLASQIGSDLQIPNRITEEQTLEKFSILAKLIRTLNTEQIAEAQRELYHSASEIDPHDESESIKRNTWIAFRDAVAQAGTGPALVIIKNWIKEKKIRGTEAALVVGVLSKTARTPTKEYMDAFFELVTMPETTKEQFLNSSALITFAELVRYSQADHPSAHSRYPVHTFGLLLPKDNPAMSRDWLPYMAEELKKSMENKENAKSLALIAALGNLADPKILAVFEPYLEGKAPASTFQRLSMVLSLNKLAALKPVLARNIFYRIYKNTGEAHQLRCAAVSSLMMTNPPVSMLERMAEFTNVDQSKHVNAAVKSNIESASELEANEWQELAKNARKAKSLLNKESYGFEYSQNYLTDYVVRELNFVYRMQSGYISSDDSFIPEAYIASTQGILGGFKMPKTTAGVMISSVKDLFKLMEKQFETSERSDVDELEFSPENIAKLLKIKAEFKEDLEGVFKIQTPYVNKFLSFDENDIQRIPEHLKKAIQALSNGHDFNTAKLDSLDMTVSFPMESGFPFVYTMKIPTIVKMSGKVDIKHESLEGSMDIRLIWAMQMQARLGFVTPFEHQHYLAGSDKTYQVQIPIRAKIKYESSNELVSLKLEPLDRNEKIKILHHSVDLFTSCHNILSMSPITKDPGTHKLNKMEAGPTLTSLGSRTHGLLIKIEMEKSSLLMDSGEEDRPERNLLERFIFLFTKKPDYDKLEVFIEPNPSVDQFIILTGSLNTLEDDTTEYDENRSKNIEAKAPEVKNKKQNDLERRKQLLNESAKGIAAADAFVVEIGIELHGQKAIKTSATLACADSEVDEKSRCQAYWRLTKSEKDTEVESCIGLESTLLRSSDTEKNSTDRSKSKYRKFDVDLRVGETCKNGVQVKIQGQQEQSEKWREAIKELPSKSQCEKDKKRGRKSSLACEEVSRKSSMLDKTLITVKLDEGAANAIEGLDGMLDLLSELTDDVRSIRKNTKDGDWADKQNTIELTMKLSPEDDTASFSYESENIVLLVKDVEAEEITDIIASADSDDMTTDRMNMDLTDVSLREYMCELDSNSVTTFDDSSYPLELGKCWHVAMMTVARAIKYSKESDSTEKIDDDMRVSVVVRDAEDGKKEVKVTLGNKELRFYNVDSKNQVKLDGQKLDLSLKRSFRHKNDKDIDFEVVQRPDGSLRLLSSEFDIDASYDGKRVQIQPSDKYRNEIRGLCGNYDGEPANDFTSPNNCLLSKSKEFAASYALTSKDCLGPANELAKKADKAVCSDMSPRPGNVVSDREAGRNSSENSEWGHHSKKKREGRSTFASSDNRRCRTLRTKIIEEADQICFSMKPVPACVSGCKATRSKPKVMPVHCMPKSPASDRIVEGIEKGANPDLSQSKYTKKSAFDMPMSCHVA